MALWILLNGALRVYLLYTLFYPLPHFALRDGLSSHSDILPRIRTYCSYLIYRICSGNFFLWDLHSGFKHTGGSSASLFLLMPRVSVSSFFLVWFLGRYNLYLSLCFLKILLLLLFCVSLSFYIWLFGTALCSNWSVLAWCTTSIMNLSNFSR